MFFLPQVDSVLLSINMLKLFYRGTILREMEWELDDVLAIE